MAAKHRYYPPPDRIRELIKTGVLCPYTKLIGMEELSWFFQWSTAKFKMRLPELLKAGVIFIDSGLNIHKKLYCSYPELLMRYCSICGASNVKI